MDKRRISALLRRAPWLTDFAVWLGSPMRPRFTAGVAGVIVNEKRKVLLAEHVFHSRYPWGLPGGWLEPNEQPIMGLKRECLEELGLTIEVQRPLLIERVHRRHLDIAYLCRPTGEVQHISSELIAYRWFSLDDLPSLLRFHRAAIQKVGDV